MIEYEANAEMQRVLEEYLASTDTFTEFTPIYENDVKIGILSKVKMDREGEMVEAGSSVELKKVPAVYRILSDKAYIIVIDLYKWHTSSDTLRKALVHRALMGITVKTSRSGETQLSTRKPDVVEFSATASRFGAYSEELEELQTILQHSVAGAQQAGRNIVAVISGGEPSRPRRSGRIAVPECEEV